MVSTRAQIRNYAEENAQLTALVAYLRTEIDHLEESNVDLCNENAQIKTEKDDLEWDMETLLKYKTFYGQTQFVHHTFSICFFGLGLLAIERCLTLGGLIPDETEIAIGLAVLVFLVVWLLSFVGVKAYTGFLKSLCC